ncbi:hypothetical protein AB835_14635 [Candidatus Endobugula sertula]|uniref:Uncharacterized protein n=1 Tax=Candidatus Endobugula sertula TaxID=62101 RepID=A0A1D2QLA6_9GAMM|nr:hypothetical protein AB835_14635 [Candidatus Endobugula sertula]
MVFAYRLCQPYRAKTKGKVERLNGYLKNSVITPLAASLNQAELDLDVTVANVHIGPIAQGTFAKRTSAFNCC